MVQSASDLMECGCGWSYTWPARCWGLWGGGVREGGTTIPGWSLGVCLCYSLGLADIQSDQFPERGFSGLLGSTLLGPIVLPSTRQVITSIWLPVFPWAALVVSGPSVESWTVLINGSFLVPSCLDHTWSRKSLCSFFPQCWHKNSFLPVSFF